MSLAWSSPSKYPSNFSKSVLLSSIFGLRYKYAQSLNIPKFILHVSITVQDKALKLIWLHSQEDAHQECTFRVLEELLSSGSMLLACCCCCDCCWGCDCDGWVPGARVCAFAAEMVAALVRTVVAGDGADVDGGPFAVVVVIVVVADVIPGEVTLTAPWFCDAIVTL